MVPGTNPLQTQRDNCSEASMVAECIVRKYLPRNGMATQGLSFPVQFFRWLMLWELNWSKSATWIQGWWWNRRSWSHLLSWTHQTHNHMLNNHWQKKKKKKKRQTYKKDTPLPKTKKKLQQDGRYGTYTVQWTAIATRWETHKLENNYTTEIPP